MSNSHQGPDLNARAQQRVDEAHARANGMEQQALRAHLQPIIGVATMEASNRGSANLEAEHLLLGFLFDKTSPAGPVLAEHGLSYESFSAALLAEREKTLAAVGVAVPSADRLVSTPRPRGRGPRFGNSAREVWDRTIRRTRARGGRPVITHADFIISILSAELGTVPRALAQAGIDRQPIIAALEATSPSARKERNK